VARTAARRLGTALGASLGLVIASRAAAQADDWSLTRQPEPATPRKSAAASSTAAPDFSLALRAVERRATIEQLLTVHRARGGQTDDLLREVEARAARAAQPRRWLLLLAQLQRISGAIAEARATFERANALGPDAFSLQLSAEFEREQNALPRARELTEQALAAKPSANLRLPLRTELLELCVALGDRPCAWEQFAVLAAERTGVSSALAYPRALASQHAYAEASAAYLSLLDHSPAGATARPRTLDTRTRCDIHLELGELRLAEAALPEARELLEQARSECHERSGEVLERLLEAHRALGSLAQFAHELAANPAPAAQQLAGRAFEELGQPTAAADAYRRALARSPADAALAERLLGLLSREGRTTELIATYERLLTEPRTEPRLLTSLTGLLLDLGRAEDAATVAARIGRARPTDVALHRLLVELYTRWEMPERARAELEWLTRIDPNEPSHVLALAEAELAQGREAQAATVLRRLRKRAATPAQGHVQLGQAFADHELPREALAEFDQALRLEPQNLAAMRGRASALSHLYRHRDAEAEWQHLLMSAGPDAERRRDAREQLVELWAELGELERHVRDYEEAFGYSAKTGPRQSSEIAPAPRDPEVGRLLAEGYLRLARQPSYRAQPARYLRGAEDVLGQVVRLDPSDAGSWRALERLRARRGDREGSIAALEQLVRLEPQRAAEHYMRMAEYAHAAYRQDAAIGYAERAAAVAPDDATVHEWLGDVYRARRDDARTIIHYQRALELDPMRFSIALRLAELHAQRGETTAARHLLVTVLSSATEPGLILRAGRAALQLAATPESRAELERQLLALVSSDPRRSEHRRLLIELYETQLPDLQARNDTDARVSLDAIRARAQKPLLDALSDDDDMQVRSAVRLLRWLGTASAALPLMTLAETGDAELAVRRSALAASSAVGGLELLPRQLALSAGREVGLRDMAAYCIARAPASIAAPAVRKLMTSETPAVRAFGALGLGQLGARDQPTSASSLRLALAHDVSALVRSAAAIALGLLSDRVSLDARQKRHSPAIAEVDASTRAATANESPDENAARTAVDATLDRTALEGALRGRDSAIAESAALGLGILADPSAASDLAHALFDTRPAVASAAELALRGLACDHPLTFELAEPEPDLTIDMLLEAARSTLSVCKTSTFAPFFAEITEAARSALKGPPARRSLALAWLSRLAADAAATDVAAAPGATIFPAVERVPAPATSPEPDAGWRIELLSSLASDLSALAVHADPAIRRDVARLFELIPVTAAETTLMALVTDPDLGVRGAALDALGRRKLPDRAAYCDRLAFVAASDAAFGMRSRAVRALGGMSGSSATRVLVRVLASDPFAVVRESAADALSGRESNLVGEALLVAMRTDAEPRVRFAAARSLRQVGGALLHTAREDPRLPEDVREILQAR
jgi:tetratricopeptide (TPR) repeat protein/HEAT repeat protein